ncbi:hypothetical protein D3C77_310770 [compost metagenome]
MPVRFSWMTPFTVSIRCCTARKRIEAFFIIQAMKIASTGAVTVSSRPNFTLTIKAIMTLPVTTSGTRVAKRRLMNSISCNCVISPVRRVMSDEVGNLLNTA